MNRLQVENGLILTALTGSRSYKLDVEGSDADYKGIFIAPKEYYLGLKNIEQKDSGWLTEVGQEKFNYLTNKDTVCFELKKFLKLASNCNPNIIELLFQDNYLFKTHLGQKLIDNRHLFLSKRAKHSFGGYAKHELSRLRKKASRVNPVCGYDSKSAMHCIRLLTMGVEIMVEGHVFVNREYAGDAKYLLDIRKGIFPLETIEEKADTLLEKLNRCYTTSELPKVSNEEAINDLCVELVSYCV